MTWYWGINICNGCGKTIRAESPDYLGVRIRRVRTCHHIWTRTVTGQEFWLCPDCMGSLVASCKNFKWGDLPQDKD